MKTFTKDWKDQCILVDILPDLVRLNDLGKKSYSPVVGAAGLPAPVTYLKGEGGRFMSNFMKGQTAPLKPFLEITPAELSLLVPKIQLFSMIYTNDEPKKFVRQDPFVFRTHVSEAHLDRVFSSGRGRLGSVGIENFSMEAIGKTSPVANQYQVNITLFAESIEAFLEGAPKNSAPYTDLISFNSGKKRKAPKKTVQTAEDPNTGEKESLDKRADPTFFEIKAAVGWAVPKDKAGLLSKPLKRALDYSEMVMKLNLVKHDIKFDQNGTVRITLEYKTKIETLLDSFRADLFHEVNITKKVEDTKEKRPSDSPKEKEEGEKSPNAKEQASQITREQLLKLYRLLEKRIKFVSVKDIVKWQQSRKEASEAENQDEADTAMASGTAGWNLNAGGRPTTAEALTNETMQTEISKTSQLNPAQELPNDIRTDYNVGYWFMSDIIEAAMALVQTPEKVNSKVYKYRVLVGPYDYVDRRTKQRVSINIGQVPIAMSEFNRFLNEEIVKKGRTRWPVMKFLKAATEKLVLRALGAECATPGTDLTQAAAKKAKIDMTVVSHSTKKGQDLFAKYAKKGHESGNLVHLNLLGNKFNSKARLKKRHSRKDQDLTFDYLVLYASHLPTPYLNGNKEQDEKAGCFHYFLGQDRGIVKSINFNRMDMPARRTYLMKQEVGAVDYLIERYNADMELVGCPAVSVGQLIHINPSIASMGDTRNAQSYGNRLGLTGYYYITRVSHTLSKDNKFTTKVHCVGQGSFYGKKPPIQKIDGDPTKGSLGSKENDAGPSKSSGEQPPTPEQINAQNDLANASVVHSFRESTITGVDDTYFRGPGSPSIEPLDPIYINDTEPPAGFVGQIGDSSPRLPTSCSNHVLGDKFGKLVLDYLDLLHPPGGCIVATMSRSMDEFLRDPEYWDDERLSMRPWPSVSIKYKEPLNINNCPTQAFVQGNFKYLEDVKFSEGWGGRWGEGGAGEGWEGYIMWDAHEHLNHDSIENQKRWKSNYYTFNCIKHPTRGWYVYDFFENTV